MANGIITLEEMAMGYCKIIEDGINNMCKAAGINPQKEEDREKLMAICELVAPVVNKDMEDIIECNNRIGPVHK